MKENEVERRIDAAIALAALTAAVDSNTVSTERVAKALFGEDDKGGLVTQVALNQQSIGRVYKLTAGAVVSVFLWAVRGVFK